MRFPLLAPPAMLLVSLALLAGCRTGHPASADDLRASIASARDRVFPALVHVDVLSADFWGGKEVKGRSTGSGTIISPEGHVLTNAHVTADGVKFWCTLADKRRVPARLIGEDPLTDLAVLRLDLVALAALDPALPPGGPPPPPATPPHASLGDSSTLAVGDYVLAMGSPFALSRSVTLGIVSNNERVFASDEGDVDEMLLDFDQRTGMFTNWIQHDALINPGNSGGPLVSLSGEVIGINTRGGAGMSFATPSNLAREVVGAILARGEVARSWVGLGVKHIEDTGLTHGVLIDSVDADGPAHAAGLRAGDVLTGIAGQPVTVRFVEEVPPLLKRFGDLPVGAEVAVAFERSGQAQSATITTRKLLKDKGDEAALRTWGVTAQAITPLIAQRRRLRSTEGVLISSVRSGSPAALAEPDLQWGDIVRTVDGKPTNDLPAIVAIYDDVTDRLAQGDKAASPAPEHLLIEYERQGKSYVTLLKPRPEERPEPPRELPKAWIGVDTQPIIKNLAEKLGHPDQRGFRVTRVYSRTRAAEAGLKVGDVILALNDEELAPRGAQEAGLFARAVRRLSIDDPATLRVLRAGATIDVPITLERSRTTNEEARRIRNTDFELVVREMTFFDRDENQWDESVKGVVVEQAEEGGWASLGGIHPGDLIQRIGERDITDLDAYKAAMEEVTRLQPRKVVFVVLRGVRTHFKFIEPDWKPEVEKTGS